jgi:ribonuclease P protein component
MERRLRLRDDADFRRARAEGRSWGHRLLTLVVRPNDLARNRYGFVVSKRVGNAVTRNLVKRRLREILRQWDRAGRIAPGHDCVLIVRPAIAQVAFADIREAVGALLTRAGLLLAAPVARAGTDT